MNKFFIFTALSVSLFAFHTPVVKISVLNIGSMGLKSNNISIAIEGKKVKKSGFTSVIGAQYAKLKSNTPNVDDYNLGELYIGFGFTKFLPAYNLSAYIMPKIYGGRISNSNTSDGEWSFTGAVGVSYHTQNVIVGIEAETGTMKISGKDSHSRNSIGIYGGIFFK
ncbi:hypothetical protein [Caminibacter pacificus]